MRTKILLLITKGDIGGAQQVVLDLATHLPKDKFDVHVGVGNQNSTHFSDILKAQEIPIHYFPHLHRSLNPIMGILFLRSFYYFLKENTFDVVHLHSVNTFFVAYLKRFVHHKTRFLFTFHGLSLLDPGYTDTPLLHTLITKMFTHIVKPMDGITCVSKNNIAFIQSKKIYRQKNIFYTPLGIQPVHFLQKTDARQALLEYDKKILSDAFIVGSIGRIAYQKNYSLFIQSIHFLRVHYPDTFQNTYYVLIGDGSEKQTVINLATDLQITDHISFIPGIPNAARFLKAFDLFCMTSRYEGLPKILIECMHASTPVISTDMGGIDELINPHVGIVIQDNTPQQMAEAIHRLYINPFDLQTYQANTTTQANLYSFRNMMRAFEEAYETTVTKM